jgi:hypothetical protein
MAQQKLDQLWEHATLTRIGGVVQGGSTKTPREQEEMNRKHMGRDAADQPEGALPPQKPAPHQEHPPQVHPTQEHPRARARPPGTSCAGAPGAAARRRERPQAVKPGPG